MPPKFQIIATNRPRETATSCISLAATDLHGAPQPPLTELQQQQRQQPGSENQAVSKKCFKPAANGIVQEMKQTPDGFEIAELATSSLLGLVATIKERITKPTAMAQGRVAHLIEWKGWNSKQQDWGGAPLQDEEQYSDLTDEIKEARFAAGLVATIKERITKPTAMAQGRVAHLIEWKGWNSKQQDWGGAPLQDEEQYSDLTDEIKEARFAAGVAEQFAIAEATMSAWSSMDAGVEHDGKLSQDSAFFPDAEEVYLQQLRMNGTQRLYSINLDGGDETDLHTQEPSPSVPSLQTQSIRGTLAANPERQGPLLVGRSCGTGQRPRRSGSIRHADSSSISEDEVFYN
ncbi:UNVERIFIED_CONTAM: hypothetical protein FKN15_064301 [Acipenser sinensis]